jgi:hypothetical protein
MFDFMLPTNWLAFVLALAATQVLGILWYGNALFGKPWMKATGKTAKQLEKEANPTVYIYSIVGAAVMIMVLSNVFRWAGVSDTMSAIGTALLMWLGFTATSSVMNTAFQDKKWNLWMINNGYHVVNMIIVSVILTMIG